MRFAQEIIESPKLGPKGGTHIYGTSAITAAVNEMGSLPTRSFSAGNFEDTPNLHGERLRELVLERGGEIGKRCMPGCVIACRNVYVDEDGQEIVGTVQFETIALVGSNLGLGNLDDVDISLGPRNEALGQIPARLEKRIDRLTAKVQREHGVGAGFLEAGYITLDIADHNEDISEET